MRRHIKNFATRHEPEGQFLFHLKSGIGALLGISLIGGLAALTHWPLLIAPLGATVILVFGQPTSPLAQPANVFGGYLLATIIGVAAAYLFPGAWWVAGLAVGVSLAGMLMLRVTHPPAGAVPLVALATPGDSILLFSTLLIGCIGLVALALVYHRIPPRHQYPHLRLQPRGSVVPGSESSSAETAESKAA